MDALVTELMDQEPSHLVPLVPPVLQASHSPHSPQAPVVVPVAANVEPHPSNTTVAFVERHGQIENTGVTVLNPTARCTLVPQRPIKLNMNSRFPQRQ